MVASICFDDEERRNTGDAELIKAINWTIFFSSPLDVCNILMINIHC